MKHEERQRDAALVNEYFQKSLKRGQGITLQMSTAKDLETYQKLQQWFMDKHHCLWRSCIREEKEPSRR